MGESKQCQIENESAQSTQTTKPLPATYIIYITQMNDVDKIHLQRFR